DKICTLSFSKITLSTPMVRVASQLRRKRPLRIPTSRVRPPIAALEVHDRSADTTFAF
ncbi:hypothetical protein Tcan_00439, partial [Toxocara canis]